MTTPERMRKISDLNYRAKGLRRLARAVGGGIAVVWVNQARNLERQAEIMTRKLPAVVTP
jgi:hypothetical protein